MFLIILLDSCKSLNIYLWCDYWCC